MKLSDLPEEKVPLQSFCYLDEDDLRVISKDPTHRPLQHPCFHFSSHANSSIMDTSETEGTLPVLHRQKSLGTRYYVKYEGVEITRGDRKFAWSIP